MEQPNRCLHGGNRGGHQCAEPNKGCVCFLHFFYDHVGFDIFSKVNDVKSIVFKEKTDDIFSDIVDISCYGGDHDR